MQKHSWRASVLRLIHFFTILSMILAMVGTAPTAALAASNLASAEQAVQASIDAPTNQAQVQPLADAKTAETSLSASGEPVDHVTMTEKVSANQTLTTTQNIVAEQPLAETPSKPVPSGPGFASTATLDKSQVVSLTIDTPLGSFNLEAPSEVRPGEGVRMAWSASEKLADGKAELELTAPDGFSWVGQEGKFDPQTRRLTLPLQAMSGELTWIIDDTTMGPFTLEASLSTDGKQAPTSKLTMGDEGLVFLDAKGGQVDGFGGAVKVSFPEGAAAEALAVRVRQPVGAKRPLNSPSGAPFEITAIGQTSKTELKHFTQPLTIEVQYDKSKLKVDENSLHLEYYDVGRGAWVPMETQVDMQNQVLRAESDHLTVFDIGYATWEAASLPSMQAFQITPFTGAATYSLPLWTPPGPAGLQPSLDLSYNSQAVDNAVGGQTQPDWVGMGWELDTGAIERVQYEPRPGGGTQVTHVLTDDSFVFSAGGISSTLLPGADGYYHTTDESFWRVQYDSGTDSWTAWDKSGTIYRFGKTIDSRAVYPYYSGCDPNDHPFSLSATYRWGLQEVENIFGQKLTFGYFRHQQDQPTMACLPTQHPTFNVTIHMYPSTISYPNGYYVYFERDETNLRTDIDQEMIHGELDGFYQRYRLKSVHVRLNNQDIRRYDMGYASGALIQPNAPFDAGGYMLTLTSVQEFDKNGVSLPATTFTYGDSLHLTQVNNGYGGRAQFGYESQPYYDLNTTGNRMSFTEACHYYGGAHPHWGTPMYGINGGSARCDSNGYLIVLGQAAWDIPSWDFMPGAEYMVLVSINSYSTNFTLGIISGAGAVPAVTTSTSSYQVITGYARLQGTANKASLYLNCTSQCKLNGNLNMYLLPTRYRLSQKLIFDGVDPSPDVFNYSFDDPAVNDTQHSLAASVSYPYVEPYSEYRGNALEREKGPDGRATWNAFYQDDARKGQNFSQLVMGEDFYDDFTKGISTTQWTGCTSPVCTAPRYRGDLALKVTDGSSGQWVSRSAYTLPNGKTALAQFQIATGTSEARVYVDSDNGSGGDYRRFGIYVDSGGTMKIQYNNGSGIYEPYVLFSYTEFKRDTWYFIQISIDDGNGGHLIRVWERDNPLDARSYRLPLGPAGRNWRFRGQVKTGTLYLDTYGEGKLFTMGDQQYTYHEVPHGTLPNTPTHTYSELKIYWTRTTKERQMIFDGDADWQGKITYYKYDYDNGSNPYFGNVVRTQEAAWNASTSHWEDYRMAENRYFPNSTYPKYLAGLLACTNNYACAAGSVDGACLNMTLTNDLITGSSWNLYDGMEMYNVAPTNGVLTGQRKFLNFNADKTVIYYQDQRYFLDGWGNRIKENLYTDSGTYSVPSRSITETTTYTYDPVYHTYMLTQTNALGQNVGFTYDPNLGLPVSMTGPNGQATKIEVGYDGFGRPIKIARPGDTLALPTLQVTYSDTTAPFPILLTQRVDGSTTTSWRKYYNGIGQLIQSQTLNAQVWNGAAEENKDIIANTWFDAYGQVVRQSVPYAVNSGTQIYLIPSQNITSTRTSYDPLGRTLVITATDNIPTIYSYGVMSTTVKDALANKTTTLNDVWGRTTMVTPPMGPGVSYTYNTVDLLVQAVRGGSTTTMTYDMAGRKTAMNDPDMGGWSYSYDALGNLLKQTDAKNQRTCLYYDPLNRLSGKYFQSSDICPTSPTYAVRYYYDDYNPSINQLGKGKRTGMTDATGSASWVYDTRGRLTSETKVVTGQGTFLTQWAYNKADLQAWMVYPGDNLGNAGEQVYSTYNSQLALKGIGNIQVPTNYVYNTQYDAAGRVRMRKLGVNGSDGIVREQYAYNAWTTQGGRLQSIQAGPGTSTTLLNLSYNYDAVGNVLSIQDVISGTIQTQSFTYDGLDRLTSAGASGGNYGNYGPESYGYDLATGNLASKTGIGSYSYLPQSPTCPDGVLTKAHAVTTAGTNTYCYDQNGNMVRRTIGTNTYNLAYDAENRLVQVTGVVTATASFGYDGDGKRLIGTEGGTTTVYIGNYFEWKGSTSTMVKYYYAGAERVAMRSGTADPLWLLGDHLGSTSVAANYNGTLYTRQGYKAWGEQRFIQGISPLPTTFRYTGQREAETIGLYFYGARWYDTSLSRFTSPDTIIPEASQGVQAWDRYAYTNNNPIKYNDPSGHSIPWNPPCLILCDNKASSLVELMLLALLKREEAEITGEALDDIENDKSLAETRNKDIEDIKTDPRYGKAEFDKDLGRRPNEFGNYGKGMLDDAFENIQTLKLRSQTWTVRNANVTTSVDVSKTGDMTFNYSLDDTLDLVPDWFSGKRVGWKGFAYNVITTYGLIEWHGILGASRMKTKANWSYTVPAACTNAEGTNCKGR
jgi:RHS repeat-associated protein